MSGTVIVTIGTTQWTGSYLSTDAERVAGLSNVPSIPAQTCAFFTMDRIQQIDVTVAEMLFPIDIIFIRQAVMWETGPRPPSGIVQINRNVAPGSTIISCPSADSFMEVNAGEAETLQVHDYVTGLLLGTASSAAIDLSGIISSMITLMMMGMMMNMMKGMMAPSKSTYNIRKTPRRVALPEGAMGKTKTAEDKLYDRYNAIAEYVVTNSDADPEHVGVLLAEAFNPISSWVHGIDRNTAIAKQQAARNELDTLYSKAISHPNYAVDTRADIMGSARDEVGRAFRAQISYNRRI